MLKYSLKYQLLVLTTLAIGGTVSIGSKAKLLSKEDALEKLLEFEDEIETEYGDLSATEIIAKQQSNLVEMRKRAIKLSEVILKLSKESATDFQKGRDSVQEDIDATEKVNAQLRDALNAQPELGIDVYDSVTGFSGTATAQCEYLEGDAQVLIENEKETRWVSLHRIEKV